MDTLKIYKMTNTINSKVYIGWTSNTLDQRFTNHVGKVNLFPELPLYAAMHEYGVHKFQMELIEEFELDDLGYSIIRCREQYWIDHYNSAHPCGYNVDQKSLKRLRGVHNFLLVKEENESLFGVNHRNYENGAVIVFKENDITRSGKVIRCCTPMVLPSGKYLGAHCLVDCGEGIPHIVLFIQIMEERETNAS